MAAVQRHAQHTTGSWSVTSPGRGREACVERIKGIRSGPCTPLPPRILRSPTAVAAEPVAESGARPGARPLPVAVGGLFAPSRVLNVDLCGGNIAVAQQVSGLQDVSGQLCQPVIGSASANRPALQGGGRVKVKFGWLGHDEPEPQQMNGAASGPVPDRHDKRAAGLMRWRWICSAEGAGRLRQSFSRKPARRRALDSRTAGASEADLLEPVRKDWTGRRV